MFSQQPIYWALQVHSPWKKDEKSTGAFRSRNSATLKSPIGSSVSSGSSKKPNEKTRNYCTWPLLGTSAHSLCSKQMGQISRPSSVAPEKAGANPIHHDKGFPMGISIHNPSSPSLLVPGSYLATLNLQYSWMLISPVISCNFIPSSSPKELVIFSHQHLLRCRCRNASDPDHPSHRAPAKNLTQWVGSSSVFSRGW